MNLHTFKDAATAKRNALVNDLDVDDDDQDVAELKSGVIGEEDDGQLQFNDAGEAFEPFNLKNERETGHFDENLNYVFKKEKGEIDAWVAQMDEVSMERAIGEAAFAMKKKAMQREQEELAERSRVKKSPIELMKDLLIHMQPGEVIAKSMRRIGGKGEDSNSKGLPKKRTMQPKSSTVASDGGPKLSSKAEKESQRAEEKRKRERIDRVTELADQLLAAGVTGIYDMTFEAIETSTSNWEYKGLDGIVYGPYSSQEISSWKAQGFLTGPTSVLMRKVSSSSTSAAREDQWVSSDSIDFGSYFNLEKEEEKAAAAAARKEVKDSSTNAQRQSKKRKSGVRFAQHDEEDDDGGDKDDEDEEDPDEDGDLGGAGKRRRKQFRWNKDHDDEDD